jgi:hypothetical protein
MSRPPVLGLEVELLVRVVRPLGFEPRTCGSRDRSTWASSVPPRSGRSPSVQVRSPFRAGLLLGVIIATFVG